MRGFGFVSCGEGTEDIFVHAPITAVGASTMAQLTIGQRVQVRFVRARRGYLQAIELRLA